MEKVEVEARRAEYHAAAAKAAELDEAAAWAAFVAQTHARMRPEAKALANEAAEAWKAADAARWQLTYAINRTWQ